MTTLQQKQETEQVIRTFPLNFHILPLVYTTPKMCDYNPNVLPIVLYKMDINTINHIMRQPCDPNYFGPQDIVDPLPADTIRRIKGASLMMTDDRGRKSMTWEH